MNWQTRKHGSWDLDMASLGLGKLGEAWHHEQQIQHQFALSNDRQGHSLDDHNTHSKKNRSTTSEWITWSCG